MCLRAVVGVFFFCRNCGSVPESKTSELQEDRKSKAEGRQELALECVDVADLELIERDRTEGGRM